jgi:hypothetical protein
MAVDRVRETCEACVEAHKGDGSAFARPVARNLGYRCGVFSPTTSSKPCVPARAGLLCTTVSQLRRGA